MWIDQIHYEEATNQKPKTKAVSVVKEAAYQPVWLRSADSDALLADTTLEELLDGIKIPASLWNIALWWGETKLGDDTSMSHELKNNENGKSIDYTVKWKLDKNKDTDRQLTNPDKVTNIFIKNVNEFLKINNVTSLAFSVGAGVGTSVNKVQEPWSYVGRLTVTFTMDEPWKKRITSLQGTSSYLIKDPNNNNMAIYQQDKATADKFKWYILVSSPVKASNQEALYKFWYKLVTGGSISSAPSTSTPITEIQASGYILEVPTSEGKLQVGKPIDKLSSEWAKCLPLFLNGKQVGSIVKCEAQPTWQSKVMFINAKTNATCFDQDGQGNYFPNPKKIEQYITGMSPAGKSRKIAMITTGPYFQSGSTMSWVAYDNGIAVGHETSVTGNTTSGRWIANISWWKLTIEHADEINDALLQSYVNQKRDIVTMSSLVRHGKLNLNASLRSHTNAHSIVTFMDGTAGEIIINNTDHIQKKAIIEALTKTTDKKYQINRALYADGDASNNYLDGIFINKSGKITYSHPDNWDAFTNPNTTQPALVKNNMPWIMVYYAEK